MRKRKDPRIQIIYRDPLPPDREGLLKMLAERARIIVEKHNRDPSFLKKTKKTITS